MKTEFKVTKTKDAQYQLTSNTQNQLTFKEAQASVAALDAEIHKVNQNIEQLQKAIDTDKAKTDMESLHETLNMFLTLKDDWAEALKEEADLMEQNVRAKVKVRKAKTGYKRISDINQKIVASNTIMSEIAGELELDVGSVLMRKVRADFEKI